jgi:hypothetical protein
MAAVAAKTKTERKNNNNNNNNDKNNYNIPLTRKNKVKHKHRHHHHHPSSHLFLLLGLGSSRFLLRDNNLRPCCYTLHNTACHRAAPHSPDDSLQPQARVSQAIERPKSGPDAA